MWYRDEDLAFFLQVLNKFLEDFYVSLVNPVEAAIARSADRGHQGVVWWEVDVLGLLWLCHSLCLIIIEHEELSAFNLADKFCFLMLVENFTSGKQIEVINLITVV